MASQGVISTKDAALSKVAPLGVTTKPTDSASPYPAFLELVQRQLRQYYNPEDLRSKGLIVLTTLDPWLQEQAERAMVNGLRKLGTGRRKLQGAMVVTRSSNGEVVAFVNGKDGDYAGFNRPLNAHRQIGSLVKVAVYLTALENSDKYSLTTTLADMPINVQGWTPQNYDGRPHGMVPLIQALANSYNLATVRLGMRLGLKEVRNTMRRMGVERQFNVVPSTLLGTVELTPFEVAQMYQTIASNGFYNRLRSIDTVLNQEGKSLQRTPLSPEQRFGAGPIFLLTYAMQRAFRAGTGHKVGQTFPSDMIIAGKTGTGSDFKDSWFAGFGSELLAVSWLGRDDNKPIGLSGGEGALVVWGDFMHAVNPKCLPPVEPSEVQWHNINDSIRIPFIAGNNRNTSSTLAESRGSKGDLSIN
jgi:penicillin-binding protein 1B